MIPHRSASSAILGALALAAALLPASLNAAPSKISIGFDTNGNVEGFLGYSSSTAVFTTPVAVSGGLLTGTSPGGDPRLVRTSSTPIFSKPAAAAWTTVRYRVRETDETPAAVTPWNSAGINVVLNSTTSATTGAVTIPSGSTSAVADGDGFFIVTADISTFTANEVRYFRFDPIGGGSTSDNNAAGNLFEVDFVEINFTNTPPALVSTTPADGVTGVAPDATLTATFDEPVTLNTTGSVTIKNLTTLGDTVISLPGIDPDGVLSVVGNVLTISPTTAVLGVPGDEIAIEISADAIKDADGVFYAGILSGDDPNWSFTIDNVPPTPEYFHPIPGSDQAPLDGALFIAFDDTVVKGTGNLIIHKADNSVIETIDVTSSNVSVNGSRVAITPTVPLAYGTSYYVLIDSGTFSDALGNVYAGISDSSVWAFATITNEATMLFGDSFNREDSNDLNASAIGKYGSLGALTYSQRIFGPGVVGNVELTSGQLLLESNENDGNAGALVYLNHNFTDAAIATAGGFSVTVDLNAFISGGSRFMTVAMGQNSTDLGVNQTSASPSSVNGSKGDLLVAYRLTTTSGTPGLFIYNNGVLNSGESVTTALPATPTRMRIDCSLPDFNSGSTVNYSVFFDDSVTAFTSGTFTWSGTNENYISLSSNLILSNTPGERHALFDNLQIRTLGGGGGSAYDTWKSQITNGLDERGEDADGDGFTNHQEFLFGTSPIASNGSLTTTEKSGPDMTIRWQERTSGATYTLLQSTTLNNDWVPSSAVPTDDGSVVGDYQPRKATVTIGSSKLFFRVQGVEN